MLPLAIRMTGRATAARIAVPPTRAIHRLSERHRDRALADALWAREQQALRHAILRHGLTEERDDRRVTDDLGKRHWEILCSLVDPGYACPLRRSSATRSVGRRTYGTRAFRSLIGFSRMNHDSDATTTVAAVRYANCAQPNSCGHPTLRSSARSASSNGSSAIVCQTYTP